nr:hypothetical protein [Tanacetum cinerariifolium]
MVTIDGDGVDWTGHAEDDIENYALIAFNSSNLGSDTKVTFCSKEREKTYAKLKKLYDEQREQLGDASIEIQVYTLALKSHEQGIRKALLMLEILSRRFFLELNLSDHRPILTDLQETSKGNGGNFARECRSKGNQESRRRDARNTGYKAKDNGRRHAKQDEHKAMVIINGEDTEVTTCSKICEESYAKIKKLYDEQREQLCVASIEIQAYNLALKKSSDVEDSPVNDRFVKVKGMYVVPPPMIGIYMPPKSDFRIDESKFTYGLKQSKTSESDVKTSHLDSCESNSSVETLEYMHKLVESKPKVVSEPKVWSDATIIKEYESDSDDEYVFKAKFPVNAARQKFSSQAASTSTVRKVNMTRQKVYEIRPRNNVYKSHSPIRRPFNRTTAPTTNFTNHKVNTAGDKTFSAVRGNQETDVKTSVGSKGQITGKSKIRTGKLDFEDVYFVKELQHFNLFSVSQMCDKKNKVLFTDIECLVLSPNFKLPDENQVLLRVPRQNNMQSFNLENVVSSGSLACLIAKATVDESNKWHRRLGHVNIKNLNKLVKGNLVRGIKREYSNARTPQQNEIAERKNRILIEAARTILADSFLPNTFWAEVVSTACYVFNKFEEKSDEGFLVGYSLNRKAFRVYNLETKRVEENLHINFLENKPNVAGKGHTWLFDLDYLTDLINYHPVTTKNKANKTAGPKEANNSAEAKNGDEELNGDTGSKTNKEPVDQEDQAFLEELKRLKRQEKEADDAAKTLRKTFAKINTASTLVNTASTPVNTASPSRNISAAGPSYTDLLTYANQDDSQIPSLEDIYEVPNDGIFTLMMLREELLQFKTQQVWILVDLPFGKKVIRTKWVYRYKKDKRGVVVRNKARLVAQRHRQEEGIDYSCFIDPKFPKKVYKVVKAMYGLHQAPRACYATLSTLLVQSGYRRGLIDKTLFIKKDKKDIMLVQVYVDDIIFGSTKKSWCDEFKALMKSRIQMSTMGELTLFLGLQVKQKEDGIFISQDKYVAEILKKFDFISVKTASTPIETKKPLVKDTEAANVDVHIYRSMIGSLMYLTASRPDIMYADCACFRFQVTPKTLHLYVVKRIFRRLISWQCKKQTIVATSTTEAEYVAAMGKYCGFRIKCLVSLKMRSLEACIQTKGEMAKTGLNIEEGKFNKLDDLVGDGNEYAMNERRSTDKIKVLNSKAEGVSAAGETLSTANLAVSTASVQPVLLCCFENQEAKMDNSEGGGTNPSSIGSTVETADAVQNPTANPSTSTSKESFDNSVAENITDINSDKLGSINAQGPIDNGGAAPGYKINISEGEDLNIYDLDNLLHASKGSPGHSSVGGPQTYRKSSRKSIMPSKLNDYVVDSKVKYGINKYVDYLTLSSDNYSFVKNLNKTYEPKSYKEEASDPRWIEAMNSEMETLIRNMTWVITEFPSGRKPIGSKWIFKVKYKSTEDVYMTLLEGYFDANDKRGSKLQKSLYGLKQAPSKWNEKLTYVQKEYGFEQRIKFLSDIDKLCLCQRKYYLELLNDFEMLAAKPSKVPLYVGKSNDLVKLIEDGESGGGDVVDDGDVQMMAAAVDDNDGGCSGSGGGGCSMVVMWVAMVAVGDGDGRSGGGDVVDDGDVQMMAADVDDDDGGMQRQWRWRMFGGGDVGRDGGGRRWRWFRLWSELAGSRRSGAIHKLSQVMHAPKQSDIKLAFKVLRYLKGSPRKGMLYVKSNFFSISAYVDSDWANYTATRRSSAEAEFRAMSNVTCEVMRVLKILTELKVSYCTPISVYCDSSAAIQITANPVFHEKTKHFEIDPFFLSEKIADGVIKTCKVKTKENVANILTKSLSIDEHKRFCDMLHLVDSF